jgi:hypothetical protein
VTLTQHLSAALERAVATRVPFPHIVIEDAVPDDLWVELRRTFPRDAEGWGQETHGKQYLSGSAARPFLVGPWAELSEVLSSPTVVAKGIRDLVPLGRRQLASRVGGVDDALDIGVQFSSLASGSWLEPHNDVPPKVLSALYFLGHPDWVPAWGGGLTFYRQRYPLARARWRRLNGSHVPEASLDRFRRDWAEAVNIPFRANTLILFGRSSRSYHAVGGHSAPPGWRRESFNLNVLLPEGEDPRPLSAPLRRAASRARGLAFRR